MAQAELHEVLPVDKAKLFATIIDYENYPKFVDGVSRVEVERKEKGKARVTYHVSIMKEVTYVLDHVEDEAAGKVSWTLVSSDFFKKNNGFWELKELGPGKTDARYGLDVEFKIAVPGFILSRLVKGNLPSMLKNFENQAKKA